MFEQLKSRYKKWRAKMRAKSLMRSYYRKSFEQICLYLRTNYIAVDSVDIYIQSAPPFLAVLEQYRQKKEATKHTEKAFCLNLDKPLASDFLQKAQDTLLMMQEEYAQTQNQPAITPTEVVAKNNKLQKLQANIQNLQITIEVQEKLLEKIKPPKRAVGRPKKDKNKNVQN